MLPVAKASYEGPGNFHEIVRQIRSDLREKRNIVPETFIRSVIIAVFTEAGLGTALRENKNFNIPGLGTFKIMPQELRRRIEKERIRKEMEPIETLKRLEKYQQKRRVLDAFNKVNRTRAKNGYEPLKLEDFIVWYKKIPWPEYDKKFKIKVDYEGKKWRKYRHFKTRPKKQ